MKTRVLFTARRALRRGLLLLLPALLGPLAARAQNVGIGTTSPTQKLDVDGNLRLRGLSGTGLRLPQVQPDGTITVGSSALLSSPANVAVPLTTLATGSASDRVFRPVLADGLLYVPNDFQLRIYDVHTPTAPVARGVISLPGAFQVAVTVVNGRRLAVVVDLGNNAFYVVDVSNPAAPSLVSSTSNATDDGAPAAILSKDNIIYISSAADVSPALARLAIWDLANPAAPVRRSSVAVGGTARLALNAADNLLYVADNQNGILRILDVTNPAAPAALSATPIGTGADGLAVSGPTLYTAGAAGLSAYDVSTPAAPRLLASVPAASGDLAVAGSVGLLASGHKLQSFDLSNPAAPVLRGAVPAPSQDVNVPDEYPAFVATDGTTGYVSIDFGARVEAFGLGGTPRVVVVGTDGSLGSVPAQAQIAPSLSLNGQTLSIGGGNSVTLPGDNLGNHLATQNLSLASYQLVGNGGTSGLNVSSTGNVGIGLGTGAAASRLHVYNASSFDVARLESGSVGPHLQFIKTNAGQAIVDYIGTDYTGFRAGALELRGGTSVQLSGDGDPSSPDLVVAATGNVGIGTGTTAPATRLDVNGVARATAVRTPATGAHNLLPAAYGSVGSGPSVFGSTDNFTVGRVPGMAVGAYRLTFNSASGLSGTNFSTSPITATLFGTAPGFITYITGTGTIDVYTFNTAGTPTDRGFSFSLFLP